MKTQVPGQMTDKWTMGSSNEGLYNGVSPPEEGDMKEKEEISGNNYCSTWKNITIQAICNIFYNAIVGE